MTERVRVATFGESMGLIRAASVGTFDLVSAASIDTGGAEGNVAIGLARLGVGVRWLGRVGSDSLGRRVVRDLLGEGVAAVPIVDASAPTGLMLKESPWTDATSVTYYRGGSAGSRLRPADLEALDLETADLLHVTGITLAISDSARRTVLAAVERASASGVAVSFDVNHRDGLWSAHSARPWYRAVAERSTVVFAGEEEASVLTGMAPAAAHLAASLAELGVPEVIIKRGARGATALVHGSVYEQDAFTITHLIDTVGAGDAFVAGYLAERLSGAGVEQRLRTAALAGAFACRHPGDWQASPRSSDLAAWGDDPVRR